MSTRLCLLLFVISIHFTMNGQYIYHDVNPDEYIFNESYDIDLNQDGIDDFRLNNINTGSPQYNWHNYIYTLDTNMILCDSNGPSVLNTGDTIFPSSQMWGTNGALLFAINTQYQSGSWYLVGTKYLGLRFAINNTWHYGWIRINVHSQIVLLDWGYNATPDSSIIAGNGIDVGMPTPISEENSVLLFSHNNKLEVSLAGESSSGTLNLYNSSGHLLLQCEINNRKTTLDCAELPSGIYLAVIFYETKRYSRKLILTRE